MSNTNSKINGDDKPATPTSLVEAAKRANGQHYRLNDQIVNTLVDLMQRVERLEREKQKLAA